MKWQASGYICVVVRRCGGGAVALGGGRRAVRVLCAVRLEASSNVRVLGRVGRPVVRWMGSHSLLDGEAEASCQSFSHSGTYLRTVGGGACTTE